jgi:hypothetical protein
MLATQWEEWHAHWMMRSGIMRTGRWNRDQREDVKTRSEAID